jgi:hypothetical protein
MFRMDNRIEIRPIFFKNLNFNFSAKIKIARKLLICSFLQISIWSIHPEHISITFSLYLSCMSIISEIAVASLGIRWFTSVWTNSNLLDFCIYTFRICYSDVDYMLLTLLSSQKNLWFMGFASDLSSQASECFMTDPLLESINIHTTYSSHQTDSSSLKSANSERVHGEMNIHLRISSLLNLILGIKSFHHSSSKMYTSELH